MIYCWEKKGISKRHTESQYAEISTNDSLKNPMLMVDISPNFSHWKTIWQILNWNYTIKFNIKRVVDSKNVDEQWIEIKRAL